MTSNNITNPFSSNQPPLEIPSAFTKLSGVHVDANVALPSLTNPYTFSTNYNNNANTINALNNTLIRYNAGQILTFSDQEVAAISNTFNVFTTYQTYDSITLTVAQQQDLVIASGAIQAIQNTGVFVTEQDLINADIEIGSANTGWFPDGAVHAVCIDQYMICPQPNTGQFYWSNSANAMDWSVLNVADMESYSDQPINVTQTADLLVAFGQQSIEFYQDIPSNYPAVWTPQPAVTQNYGLAAEWSVFQYMNSVAFLGQNQTGQIQFFMLNGYTPTVISSDDVDTIINSFTVYGDCIGYPFVYNGHTFAKWDFPTANRCFLYDGTTGIWSEFQSGVQEFSRHVTSLGITFNGTLLASDAATGNLYFLDSSSSTDNGFLIRREFVSKHITQGGPRFTISELWLDVNTGAGNQVGNLGNNPQVELYWSHNNGNTWKGPRFGEMGAVGEYYKRVVWRRLGRHRDVVFKFVITDPVQFVIARGMASLS